VKSQANRGKVAMLEKSLDTRKVKRGLISISQ